MRGLEGGRVSACDGLNLHPERFEIVKKRGVAFGHRFCAFNFDGGTSGAKKGGGLFGGGAPKPPILTTTEEIQSEANAAFRQALGLEGGGP